MSSPSYEPTWPAMQPLGTTSGRFETCRAILDIDEQEAQARATLVGASLVTGATPRRWPRSMGCGPR